MALLESDGTRLHALLIRLTLRRDLAEELMQELFVRLSQSPGFASAEHPFAYARRVAINLAMERRRTKTPVAAEESLIEVLVEQSRSPLTEMIRAEQLEQILDGLANLPELSRECFVLRFIEQEPYETIAERIGKTPHQARGLCHAAVRQLRESLSIDLKREPIDG